MTMEAHTQIRKIDEIAQLKNDVLTGLSLPNKALSSEYCFDQTGVELFNQLEKSPENYPTLCEASILEKCQSQLSFYLENKTFHLIEFGVNGGVNSRILLEAFLSDSFSFHYSLVNSSNYYLNNLNDILHSTFPELKYDTIYANYLASLKEILSTSKEKNIILLLNSAMGKIPQPHVSSFLNQLRRLLHTEDYVLIGFDLRKNIDRLLNDYNHPNSLYKKFYLNLLERINRELEGNFNISHFNYMANYNKDMESINHFLVSTIDQTIKVNALQQSFHFKANESIYIGSDTKYREQQIETLAEEHGFEIVQMFSDENNNFIDSLWKVHRL